MNKYWEVVMLPLIRKRRNDPSISLADCSWQVDDWEWAWDQEHACLCRSRGGSKTFDFTHYVSFRALRTKEKWAWLTPKGGQLSQAHQYFVESPLYYDTVIQTVGNSRKHFVQLVDKSKILIGIVSTSNLGMRLDGIACDEEEDMEPKQQQEIYPQMEGMMTDSKTGQFLHLGTLWIGSKFNEEVESYPTKKRPWDIIPHLLHSPKMLKIIANKHIAEWEKDLLYRCIATAPSGVLFPNLHIGPLPEGVYAKAYGFDFGAHDTCVGVAKPNNRMIYVCSEQQFDLERNPSAVAPLRAYPVEGESGGYNDDDRYGKKSAAAAQWCNAICIPVTNAWKAARQQQARECEIYIDPQRTPNTFKDLKNAQFDEDGLYKKSKTDPVFGMHYLDAFLHGIGAGGFQVWQISREKVATSSFR